MKKGSIDIQELYDLIIELRTKIDKYRELYYITRIYNY